MDRTDVVLLVNSTPKYYYILPFFFAMLRRYAPTLQWKVVLATEFPNDSMCVRVKKDYDVELLEIPQESAGFLDSRLAALKRLAPSYNYCLPLQDDFILEMPMDAAAFEKLFNIFANNPPIMSARLMPCPPPQTPDLSEFPGWKYITLHDEYKFVFQATLWRTDACLKWYERICAVLEKLAPKATTSPSQRNFKEIRENIAENSVGQAEFWRWSLEMGSKHIGWIRAGPDRPNAVYISPFPYRPTAIVRGHLEDWAIELAKRERLPL